MCCKYENNKNALKSLSCLEITVVRNEEVIT